MAAMPLRDEEIEYPTSDGRPMAESTLHRKVMADLIAALEWRYLDETRVWAGGIHVSRCTAWNRATIFDSPRSRTARC